jgi:hypothetical protein
MPRLDARTRATLVGHGLAVMLLGLLLGFPYALVIQGSLAGSERAWRMAHLEGVLNGLLLVAVGAAGDSIALTPRAASWLRWALIVTAWGNLLGAALGAASGERGLSPAGPAANEAVYLLFMGAVVAVLGALVLAAVGAFRAARGE